MAEYDNDAPSARATRTRGGAAMRLMRRIVTGLAMTFVVAVVVAGFLALLWNLPVLFPTPPPPPPAPQDQVQVVAGYGKQVGVYCLGGYRLRVDRTESQEHALLSCILDGATITPVLPSSPNRVLTPIVR